MPRPSQKHANGRIVPAADKRYFAPAQSRACIVAAEGATLKILYHHRTQGRGAEGQHITRIVMALRELGHEVDVLSPPGVDPLNNTAGIPVDRAGRVSSRWEALWRWVSLHLPNALFELAEIGYNVPAFFRLRRAMKRTSYDLVYERYAFYLLAGAVNARRFGAAFVLEANEVNGVELRVRPQTFPSLCRRFEAYLFGACTSIHTVSSYLKDRIIEQGVPAERVVVSPNAFDVQRIANRPVRSGLREQLNLAGKQVIGFAGWFSDWDRLDFLIDVFSKVRTVAPDAVLLLVGDGPMVSDLKNRCRSLGVDGHVVFTGPVPRAEVYDYIGLLDVAVLPHSNRFGSPMVMFEFMGMRVPIVAPVLEPISDVQVHGQTALLFPPLDEGECVRAITSLLRDPQLRARLASAAFDKLQAEHTWQRNAQRIIESVPAR